MSWNANARCGILEIGKRKEEGVPHDVEDPLAEAEAGHEGVEAGDRGEAEEDTGDLGVRLPVVPAAHGGQGGGDEGLHCAGRGEREAEAVDHGDFREDPEEAEAVHVVDVDGLGAAFAQDFERLFERNVCGNEKMLDVSSVVSVLSSVVLRTCTSMPISPRSAKVSQCASEFDTMMCRVIHAYWTMRVLWGWSAAVNWVCIAATRAGMPPAATMLGTPAGFLCCLSVWNIVDQCNHCQSMLKQLAQ